MRLVRGHVVALRRQGAGIVWQADAAHVWILPIAGSNGPRPRHRADVRIHETSDIFEMGLSFRYPVVHCHSLRKAERSDVVGVVPLGQTPAALMASIVRAAQREASEQAYEARMAFMRPRAYAISAAVL
jgi:hypothetical protein